MNQDGDQASTSNKTVIQNAFVNQIVQNNGLINHLRSTTEQQLKEIEESNLSIHTKTTQKNLTALAFAQTMLLTDTLKHNHDGSPSPLININSTINLNLGIDSDSITTGRNLHS